MPCSAQVKVFTAWRKGVGALPGVQTPLTPSLQKQCRKRRSCDRGSSRKRKLSACAPCKIRTEWTEDWTQQMFQDWTDHSSFKIFKICSGQCLQNRGLKCMQCRRRLSLYTSCLPTTLIHVDPKREELNYVARRTFEFFELNFLCARKPYTWQLDNPPKWSCFSMQCQHVWPHVTSPTNEPILIFSFL